MLEVREWLCGAHGQSLALTLPLISAGIVGLPPVQRTTTVPSVTEPASVPLPSAEPVPPYSPVPAANGADDAADGTASPMRPWCTVACDAATTLQPTLRSASAALAVQMPLYPACLGAELAPQALQSGMQRLATQAAAAVHRLPVLLTDVTREAAAAPEMQLPSSAEVPLPVPEPAQPHTDAEAQTGKAAEATAVGVTAGGAAQPHPQQPVATLLHKPACRALSSQQKAHRMGAEPAGATACKAGSAGRVWDEPAPPSARTLPRRGARDRNIDRDEMGLDSVAFNKKMQRQREEEAAAAAQPAASPHGGDLPIAVGTAADTSGAAGGRSLVADGREEQQTHAVGCEPGDTGVPRQMKVDRRKHQAKRLSFKKVSRLCHLPPNMHIR